MPSSNQQAWRHGLGAKRCLTASHQNVPLQAVLWQHAGEQAHALDQTGHFQGTQSGGQHQAARGHGIAGEKALDDQ